MNRASHLKQKYMSEYFAQKSEVERVGGADILIDQHSSEELKSSSSHVFLETTKKAEMKGKDVHGDSTALDPKKVEQGLDNRRRTTQDQQGR